MSPFLENRALFDTGVHHLQAAVRAAHPFPRVPFKLLDVLNVALFFKTMRFSPQECTICKQQCGAPIQCQQARCVKAYHVMCARLDGLYMKMVAKKDGMETRSYCRQHK